MSFLTGSIVAVVCVMSAGVALAASVTVNASTDVWLFEALPDNIMEDDNLNVWSGDRANSWGGTGTHGYTAIEFDLSGVTTPITNAHLELYALDYGRNLTEFQQTAALISPPGISTLTWNTVSGKTQDPLEALGHYNLAANLPMATWYDSNTASASDVSKLEALRTGTGSATFLLMAASTAGERDWGDIYNGFAPRLVLNAVPEPTTGILLLISVFGLIGYARQKQG
jgi:hypothetical protein